MSIDQTGTPEPNDPALIPISKRSLFTPSADVAVNSIPPRHMCVPHRVWHRHRRRTVDLSKRTRAGNHHATVRRHHGEGHTLKSFAYTTDAVIIRNTNANAILAVYPFTGSR